MDSTKVIEDFFGVYLLFCLNEKYRGRTYIGFTVDPNRRLNQHNRGSQAGGARKTNNKGPWKMVLIVHGFPNNIAALRFEWAWQNPERTRRLHHVENIKKMPRKENVFQYNIRILSEMLRVGPWNRLPLTIRWLSEDFVKEFPPEKQPPSHMPICHGRVKSTKFKSSQSKQSTNSAETKLINLSALENITNVCTLCSTVIAESRNRLECLSTECDLVAHIRCLAGIFLESGEYVPIEGVCPVCGRRLLWGDLIRKSKGCSGDEALIYRESESSNSDDDDFQPSQPVDNAFCGEDKCYWSISSDESL